MRFHLCFAYSLLILISLEWFPAVASPKISALHSGWQIQDSAQVPAPLATVSTNQFTPQNWINTSVPSTVLGSIVQSGQLGYDPFYGTNLKNLPGSGDYYVWGQNYGNLPTPVDSPFGHAWIYRKTFEVSLSSPDQYFELIVKGLTYSADVWINGIQIAKKEEVRGSYREFRFNITKFLNNGTNVVALSISPSSPSDLTPSWVDWNHTPQDKNMGIWNEVFIEEHGAVSVAHSEVISQVKSSKAILTIITEAHNNSSAQQSSDVTATFDNINVSQNVVLQPGETRVVRFDSENFPALILKHPSLWWPYQMGQPTLHALKVAANVQNQVSDEDNLKFGIREVTSQLTSDGSRLFKINGKPILIRGAGWASDMYLRFSKDRQEKELKYVQDLGLNTIRLEGRFETDSLLDLADREGILVMTGWVCCNYWQQSKNWNSSDLQVATYSLRDQVYNFRSHASTLAFLYGSDEAPSQTAENIYYKVFESYDWPNPILASAANTTTNLNGPSGFKMNGPYDYTPPSYWSIDKKYGGAFGFNTETSPGPAIPPIESLKQFIPPDHLWPVDEYWKFHAGAVDFAQIDKFVQGLNRRYGQASSADEFALKSQALAYENHRAMFEAFAKTKYEPSTGIIQWMLNNAWPSLIWHLYDYYLRPGGAYFGAKKANSSLHLIYGYDDNSIYLTNHTQEKISDLTYTAEAFDLQSKSLFKIDGRAFIAADTSKFIRALPNSDSSDGVVSNSRSTVSLPKTYFLKLTLKNSEGETIDDNFYWLSTQKEIYDWNKTDFTSTPVIQDADLTSLNSLPISSVTSDVELKSKNHGVAHLRNSSSTLAFLIHTRLLNSSEELLPVLWSDNYISLLPGESRDLEFDFSSAAQDINSLRLELQGWNIVTSSISLK